MHLGVLSDNYFLGNFSRGTGRTVALNTLDIHKNESLGIEVSGGSLPDQMKAEIIQATVDKNGTLAEITTMGPKIAEVPIMYDATLEEPTMDKNRLNLSVPGAGDYLLLIETVIQQQEPVIIISIIITIITIITITITTKASHIGV